MTAPHRNTRVDILKGIAIIAVVVAHTGWHAATTYTDALPSAIWLCVAFLAHASVPVFMLVTGYFYDAIFRRRRVGAYLTRLLWLGFIGCVLLAVSDIFFRPEIYDTLTGHSWLRFILLGEYPLGEPMWFIPAMIGAVLLMRLTDKVALWPKAAWAIVGLGAVGMVVSHLPDISPCWGRNALLMGFPVMAIGRLIDERVRHNPKTGTKRFAWLVVGAGCLILALETVEILDRGYPLPFTPGLTVTAVGALLVAVCGRKEVPPSPSEKRHTLVARGIASAGRHSGSIYVIHGALFPMLAAVFPYGFIYLTGVLPAITIAGSWGVAVLVAKALPHRRRQNPS